jgi:hypothetical protein
MRGKTKITLVAVCGLLSAGLVVGQPGGFQPPFGGGGFGGFGGDAYSLVKNKQVQKELKMTEEQIEKIPGAVEKAIKGVLDDKQMARLNQIQLQMKGTAAFKDPEIQTKLKFTKAQKEDISALYSDYEKEVDKLRKEGGKGGGFKKIGEMRKELEERVQSVLTSEQKTQWEGMTGEKFKMQFGGGGPGGGKKPKDDA